MDLTMPNMSGWETASILRRNHLTLAPIMIVSANAEEQGKANDAEISHEDFVVKPVDLNRVLLRLGTLLNLRWIRDNSPATVQNRVETAHSEPLPENPANESCRENPLSLAHRQALEQLVKMGYVRGILSKLDEIEQHQPEAGGMITQLRDYVTHFKFDAFLHLLNQENLP